ncbi:33914_t:CDS:2, partial [Racocetra persica]
EFSNVRVLECSPTNREHELGLSVMRQIIDKALFTINIEYELGIDRRETVLLQLFIINMEHELNVDYRKIDIDCYETGLVLLTDGYGQYELSETANDLL